MTGNLGQLFSVIPFAALLHATGWFPRSSRLPHSVCSRVCCLQRYCVAHRPG
ncbi:hypothetical protein [Kocuria atrinae]|uniref:hypothetical protein n=1 Tax=Kocuria atrinae TaxID=592377 RepID=UPI0002F13180|nr:hypothetical protein [Kocuria atrinae]